MQFASLDDIRAFCRDLPGGGAARGAGRGVDDDGLARKRAAIKTALHFYRGILGDPPAVAAAPGGRELAAIAGAVRAALACHAGMVTFMEAGVSAADA
jgi:nicotinate-nucleotide--dimethylbenzimidazole phosphoribosyltransferase